jgi:hypothetical protein
MAPRYKLAAVLPVRRTADIRSICHRQEEPMKRLPLIAVLTVSAFAAGCSLLPMAAKNDAAAETQAAAVKPARQGDGPQDRITIEDEAGSVTVQKVPFRSGISSASVERLAKHHGCAGRTGAGLVTEKGPVEVYRMQCENGTTFLAQCELRQCRPMR